jgi:hypothetical protein
VATAARLSAAFPYVSPATTLGGNSGRRYHLVDGGYYDNYGLVVTSQWLDDALSEMYGEQQNADPPLEIDVVIIRSLVDANADLVAPLDPQVPDGARTYTPPSSRHGWAWQIVAPPTAFINGRTFGQWAGGNQVLRLLIAKWDKRSVTIVPHLFDLPASALQPVCRIEPLSWKLTTPQRAHQRRLEQDCGKGSGADALGEIVQGVQGKQECRSPAVRSAWARRAAPRYGPPPAQRRMTSNTFPPSNQTARA